MAAAAAARLNGFPGPPGGSHPGFGPPHPMIGHSPFFRPHFPPPHSSDFHPGGHPGPMLPPHPHFMGHHRPHFNPRPFMMQQPPQPPQPPAFGPQCAPGIPNGVLTSSSTQNGFLTNFHQSVVGDLRAGKYNKNSLFKKTLVSLEDLPHLFYEFLMKFRNRAKDRVLTHV